MNTASLRHHPFACLALGAALALGGLDGALAATPAYGSGCSYNGSTLAEGGSPDAILSNAKALTGQGCGGDVAESHGTLHGAQWTGDYYFDYSFAQGAQTSASASAGMGSLHAFSHSTATSTPKSYFYTANSGESVAIDNTYRAYGASAASSYWYDEIVVRQGAQYGRVVLKFTLTLSGSEGVSPGIAGMADIYSRLIVDDDRGVLDYTVSLDQAGSTYVTAGFWPGTVIRLYGDLTARTEVRAGGRYQLGNGLWVTGNYIPSAEASANAANTAGFYVDVLTDGASYTSASGHSYVTAVPEPASAWLMSLGALLLLGGARRRLSVGRAGVATVRR